MKVREVLFNFIRGRHTSGQMLNLLKYFWGGRKSIVDWHPIYISVFPTFKCNLNCDMCLTHSQKKPNPYGQKPGADMDFQLFKDILDRYRNALVVNLIGNGEPLFNKDLFRMIEFAASKSMYTVSGSNGIVVGDYLQQIVDSPLGTFIVSINGHNRTEFNRITGAQEKFFDLICRNTVELVRLRDSRKSRLRIFVSIILDKRNYGQVKEMIYFAQSLGVDGVLFFQFLPSPAPGFTPEERCLFSDDANVLRAFSEAKALNLKRRFQVVLPPLLSRSANNKLCTSPFYNLAVDGEGNVGGCSCQLLNFSQNGNFYDEEDPWNNRYFQEFRKSFIDRESSLLWPCKYCYNNTSASRLVANPGLPFYIMRRIFHKVKISRSLRP